MPKHQLFTLFISLIFGVCRGQNQVPPEPPIPFEKFKKLSFKPPAPDIWAVLKIPFLDGERYGLSDAEGQILIEPQFEDIEWLNWDLPIFKAKKMGKWAFFDFNGQQALPFSSNASHELLIYFERKGYRFDEDGNHIEQLISKIKDPRPATYSDPSGATKSAHRFYFLKPETHKPYRSWFVPDHLFFIRATRNQWMMSGFTSDYQYENLKVMDEKGRFGLLDRDGNLLQPPVRNCATLGSNEKILILDEHDRIALRDARRGWQTDFLFNNVETTPVPGLFLGEFYEKGQPTLLYQIDSSGKVMPIEGMTKMEWLENLPKKMRKNDRFQIVWDTSRAVLNDLQTGKEIFRIAHGRIAWAGSGFFDVEKNKKHGWLDSTGRLLLPIEFDQFIGIWPDRRLIAIKNGLTGLYDRDSGTELIAAQFPYLARRAPTYGRGPGFQIRSGKDWICATRNLEVVGQGGPNTAIKKSDYHLPETAPVEARNDFDKAILPEIFTSVVPIVGPKWLHLFRSDGPYITSLETDAASVAPVFFSRYEHLLDEGNAFFTSFAMVQPAWPAKPYFVRMTDGKIFKN